MVASRAPPPGDLAHDLGMYPDWELNLQPFGSQACTQSSYTSQGLFCYFCTKACITVCKFGVILKNYLTVGSPSAESPTQNLILDAQ